MRKTSYSKPGGFPASGAMWEKEGIYRGRPTCFICEKVIKDKEDYRYLLPDKKEGRRFYHIKCGPGSEAWLKKFPEQEEARLLYFRGDRKDLFLEYAELIGKNTTHFTARDVFNYFTWLEKREVKMKKEKAKKVRGKGLVPKVAIEIPKELLKHPDIGATLTKLLKARETKDDLAARECRKQLRSYGFKLSSQETWKKFLAGKRVSKENKGKTPKEEKE